MTVRRASLCTLLFLACGCDRGGAAPTPAASASAAPSATTAAAEPAASADADRGIRPVYPDPTGPADPRATKLCHALHVVPAERKAACCKDRPSVTFESECLRTVGFALSSGAATTTDAEIDACVTAIDAAYAGCDWVMPSMPPAPAACLGILHGTRKERETCRSSLECAGDMRCQGLGPTVQGVCAPPRPPGYPCATGVDTLATYASARDLDTSHPECEGYCVRGRCEAARPSGGACQDSRQCGRGAFCASGTCRATAPKVGEACTDQCEGDARCIAGKCAAPKAEGEACQLDRECKAACVPRGDAGSGGTCGTRCFVAPPGSMR